LIVDYNFSQTKGFNQLKKKWGITVNKIDWCYVIPKSIFVVPIIIVLLFGLGNIFRNKGKEPDYPFWTFFLLATWLGSEAIEIVVSKFSNPTKAAVKEGISDALPQIGYLVTKTGRKNILAALGVGILRSRESIDVISWTKLPQCLQDPVAKEHFIAIEKRLTDKYGSRIILRRLFWKPEHLDVIEAWSKIYNNILNSEFKYYESSQDKDISLLPCFILDQKIIHFGFDYLGTPNFDEIDITVKDPKVVEAFKNYFTYMWSKAEYVKQRDKPVDMQAISRLRKHAQANPF
jgi:hypothetical protein